MVSIQSALGLDRDSGCVVIAEVAQAHDGSLGFAHAHIDAAADAGADAVKFQTHIADAESTPAEPWRVKFSRQDDTRFEYWQRMEFSEAQWEGLRDHALERGLLFLSTPFSPEAVELLDRVGVCAWKVASGEVTNLPMLTQMAETGKPILLSTGMSSWAEIDEAFATVRHLAADIAVFQCTTSYPNPPEQIGFNVLGELRDRYGVPVGLSDHSASVAAGLAAVALGAELLEVHLALSPWMYGPDVKASLTVEQLTSLTSGVRFIERALDNPVDKDKVAEEMSGLRSTFGKSIVASRDLPAGTVLEPTHLALKKPGMGLPASRLGGLVGRRLVTEVKRNQQIDEGVFS